MKPLALFCLICLAFATSCKKDHQAPQQQPLDSFRLDLNFPARQNPNPYGRLNYYELIVSEGSGRIVLDTLADFDVPVITWLKTNQKLLDVTIVQQTVGSLSTAVHTYKAIDLTAWTNIPDNDSIQIPAGGGGTAPTPLPTVVTYSGVNVPLGSYYNILENGLAEYGQAYSNAVYGTGTSWPGVYFYLIFPDLGLYNIHQIVGQSDAVDFSHPDTAVNVSFNRPAVYTASGFSIMGYPDTTNLETGIDLTYRTPPGAQLITNATNMYYPGAKGFKKYFFSYSASDAGNIDQVTVTLPWVDTVPANIAIPDTSWYTITKTADTGMSVQFNNTRPTYYNLVTTVLGNVNFTLTAPADSTLLHPVAFFRSLKSRMLGNFDYSQMQFSSIYIDMDAQPDYRTYWVGKNQIFKAYSPNAPAYTTFQHQF
ncbi:MAG TPA: hypothetical protein VGS79_00725 [Puia sp.]|nr:hypothetical protein [Puia sp.]